MKKLTILVGLVTSTMLITASNTGTSSSSETEATRKEIIKEIFPQSTNKCYLCHIENKE